MLYESEVNFGGIITLGLRTSYTLLCRISLHRFFTSTVSRVFWPHMARYLHNHPPPAEDPVEGGVALCLRQRKTRPASDKAQTETAKTQDGNNDINSKQDKSGDSHSGNEQSGLTLADGDRVPSKDHSGGTAVGAAGSILATSNEEEISGDCKGGSSGESNHQGGGSATMTACGRYLLKGSGSEIDSGRRCAVVQGASNVIPRVPCGETVVGSAEAGDGGVVDAPEGEGGSEGGSKGVEGCGKQDESCGVTGASLGEGGGDGIEAGWKHSGDGGGDAGQEEMKVVDLVDAAAVGSNEENVAPHVCALDLLGGVIDNEQEEIRAKSKRARTMDFAREGHGEAC